MEVGVSVLRRLAPVAGVLTVLALVAPTAMATPSPPESGSINVEITAGTTTGMVQSGTTWAPDGTSDPAMLNATDLANSSLPSGTIVTVSTTSTAVTGTASTDAGDIDLQANPNVANASVTFTPAPTGVITIDTQAVTLDETEFNGPVQLGEDTTVTSSDNAAFESTVDGAHALTLAGNGGDFWGDVGGTTPLASITTSGDVRLFQGHNITTTGAQDYKDGAQVVGVSSFTSTGSAATGKITFGGAVTVEDSASLVTKADGTTEFDGTVGGYGSITTEGYSSGSAGKTAIDTSSISSTQASSINFDNAVQLGADLNVSADGGPVTFSSTIDSASGSTHSLTDTSQDDVAFDGAVGATTPLSSVELDGEVTIGGDVTTTGTQTYGQPLLGSSPTLKSTGGDAITFTGALTGDSQDSLTTHTTGTTDIEKGVEGTVSGSGITALDINGPSTVAGTVHTSGDQTYGGAVTFGSSSGLISDSGSIDSSHSIDLGNGNVQIRGSGTLSGTISNGSLTLGSGSASSSALSYTLALTGDNTYGGGTTVSGVNSLAELSSGSSFGTGNVTLTGGAGLKWAPGSNTDISSQLNSIGNAVFDTNGNNVTLASPIHQSVNVGSVVKQGAGQLTLSADNPITLPWDVKAGTLAVSGSLAGPVTVEGGAGFNLSGQVAGHVTVNQSGTLTCLGGTLGNGLSNSGAANYAPAAPTGVSAVAGPAATTVSFTPGATRCSPLTGYEVTAEPGDIRASGTGSPITVSGLKSGTAYTFTVTATNVIGTSAASAASTPVATPRLVNASISSPGTGHAYELGQKVATTFSCTGVTSGALSSCQDSNGATTGTGRLNTSTPGRHTYVVTATASDGSTETASLTYTVSASNQFTLSKIVAHAHGLITFTLKLPDAGALRVLEKAGKRTLASATRFAKGATTLHYRLTLSKADRKLLGKHPIRATLRITFTPIGGHPRTLERSGLRLKR
jgi:autotransporter-associated beta strand protein